VNCLIVGASAGLGRSLSEQAARLGHNVLLVATDSRDLAAMASSLQLEYGVKASYISFRFGGLAEEATAVVSAAREFGSVDLLLFSMGLAEENDTGFLNEAAALRLIRVNFLSQVNLTTALWPALLARERAAVVGFGSVAAVRGRGRNVVYAAAKRALASYFESLRHLAVGTNIRVHFYYLGYLDTQQTFGKVLPLPRTSSERLASLVLDRLESNSGPVYYPWFWGPISWLLRCLPWFLYKRLNF
jgi:decaprenylphospho-beta-D-erythro-pentofuranosid-2-ulose 2-reductase